MRMKYINLFYYFVIFLSYSQVSDCYQNNRVFVMELKSWSTDEDKPTKTCLTIIGTGAKRIDFGTLSSNKNGKAQMIYGTPKYIAKEFFSQFISKITIYSYDCAYDIEDTDFSNKQDIIELTAYEFTEFTCVNCISQFNLVRITANIRIVYNEFNKIFHGITFHNTNIKFNNYKLGNGSCCSNKEGIRPMDKCDRCYYNYLIKIDQSAMLNYHIYDTSDNGGYIVQNIIRNGIFDIFYLKTSKINVTIQEKGIFNIDEFKKLSDVKLYPFRRLYFYSLSGDFKNVEITGSLMLTTEKSCGNMGFKFCNYINENFTFDDDGEQICSNPIYDNPPRCNNDNSPCSRRPCKNEAKCISIIGNYLCICKAGWAGINCDKLFCNPDCGNGKCLPGNKCEPKSARNKLNIQSMLSCTNYTKCKSGNCIIDNGIRKCVCDETKSFGEFCEYFCENPCKYGQCVMLKAKPTCICGDALLGLRCGGINQDQIKKIMIIVFITGLIIFLIITIAAILYCYFISKSTKYLNFLQFKKLNDPNNETENLNRNTYYIENEKSNFSPGETLAAKSTGMIHIQPEKVKKDSAEKTAKKNNTKNANDSLYFATEISYDNEITKQKNQSSSKPTMDSLYSRPDDSYQNPYL